VTSYYPQNFFDVLPKISFNSNVGLVLRYLSKNRILPPAWEPLIYIVLFFNIWFGVFQQQKQLGYSEGRKIG